MMPPSSKRSIEWLLPEPWIESAIRRAVERCDLVASCSESVAGITRTFCSPAMRQCVDLVANWMEMEGMVSHVDGLGNLIGRYQVTDQPSARQIVIGSHLDSVRNAGRYDGVLGVILGIEVVAAIRKLGVSIPWEIVVVGFSEEEGVRYSMPYLGSLAICGQFQQELLDRVDAEGISIRQALVEFGAPDDPLTTSRFELDRVAAYFETHIEQGPILESSNCSLGCVQSIVGQSRLRLSVEGKAGHAGTVPMEHRQDALAAAAACVLELESVAKRFPNAVATVGWIQSEPNASNVIPGDVRFSMEVRHASDEIRSAVVDESLERMRSICESRRTLFSVQDRHDFAAVPMSDRLVRLLQTASLDCGITMPLMHSGAGHDAAVMAASVPTGLIFMRNPGGISHHPDESIVEEDIGDAISVLVQALIRLADFQ